MVGRLVWEPAECYAGVMVDQSAGRTPEPALIARHCSGQLLAVRVQFCHHQRALARRCRRGAATHQAATNLAYRLLLEYAGLSLVNLGFMVMGWNGVLGRWDSGLESSITTGERCK